MRRNVPVFAGKRILTPEGKDGDANGAVIKELIAARQAAGQGHAAPFLSALLALQGAGDLPRHAAMVRRRSTSPSRTASTLRQLAHDGDRAKPNGIRRAARTASARMVEGPPRLGAVAPARLGRAAGDLRRQEDRRGAERSGGLRAHRARPSRPKAPMPGSPRRRRASWARAATPTITSRSTTFSTSGSIPARPMSSRWKIPSTRNWPQSGARRSLSRRLGPASRLVPVLAAGKLRHARPRALSTAC